VKIDRSFVRQMSTTASTAPKDTAIVRSIVALGHNLGLEVVAEGVEDRGTWEQLQALGGDMAQGYYVSRPLTRGSLDDWLESSPWGQRITP